MSNKIFKKKEVLKLIKEDMIPYGENPNRINPSIERRLTNRQNPLGANPAYPEGTPQSNFEEIMASEQFKNSIEKIKSYASRFENINVVDRRGVIDMMGLVRLQMALVNDMISRERNHKPQLEKLAIKLLKQDFNIPGELQTKVEDGKTIYYDGTLQYDVSLTLPVDLSDVQKEAEMEMEQEPEEVIENIEELDLEVAKRRFLNAMMAGAAFKGQYMFHMAEDEINAIDEDLIDEYGLLMAITEWAYFMIPPEAAAAASSGERAGGSERVDFTTDPPTLICRARSFPLLCHEIVKSYMEYMSAWGLPQSDEEGAEAKSKYILSKADFLEAENWDLMLGPNFWSRFLEAIDENELDIKSKLYIKIAQMPPRDFNIFMKEILKKSDRGKQMMVDLANDIKDAITKEDYETAMGSYEEPEEDIDIDDIDISDLFK